MAEHRLTLPCADTVGDSVAFTRLTDMHEGLVAVTAIEDGAYVVVHLDADSQRQLRDWLNGELAGGGDTGER